MKNFNDMIDFRDIFYKMNKFIIDENKFDEFSIESQKKLVETCLKKYTMEKLQKLGHNKLIEDEEYKMLSLIDLFDVLSNVIPKEKHFDTLRFYIHYILEIAGFLQGWSITWLSEECKETEILFNIDGKWDKLKTPLDEDYVQTFKFVYDVFQNQFMVKPSVKKITNK